MQTPLGLRRGAAGGRGEGDFRIFNPKVFLKKSFAGDQFGPPRLETTTLRPRTNRPVTRGVNPSNSEKPHESTRGLLV